MVRPPIVVFDDTSVPTVYETVDAVEGHLEAFDIDECTAYDADGRKLVLRPTPHYGVKVVASEEDVFYVEELRGRLVTSLHYVGLDVGAGVSLDELLSLSVTKFAFMPPDILGCLLAPLIALRDLAFRKRRR